MTVTRLPKRRRAWASSSPTKPPSGPGGAPGRGQFEGLDVRHRPHLGEARNRVFAGSLRWSDDVAAEGARPPSAVATSIDLGPTEWLAP